MQPKSKTSSRLVLLILIIPAIAVTVASLVALITSVVNVAAESRPGELLYPLRQPALELQFSLVTDPDERAHIEVLLTATPPALNTATAQPPISVTSVSSPTSAANTLEPEPSHTPEPTLTQEPSRTPELTRTQEPSRTPEPTKTQEPSRTPEPTKTQEPSRTPEPTKTQEPSRTPEPTKTPIPSNLPNSPTPGPVDVRWEGGVQVIGAIWVVAGKAVNVDNNTEIRDNPQIGDTVEVRALQYADGRLVAVRITRK